MSRDEELLERISRLETRVAREKAARQEAEAIAERVTSERWDQRTEMEDKLAVRTSELQAAHEQASRTAAEREQVLSEVSHSLRTALTALFFEFHSLSADEPLGETRLAEVKLVLEQIRGALDEQAFEPTASGQPGDPSGDTGDSPGSEQRAQTLSNLVEEHEDRWHMAAAQAGKLLMVDLAPGSTDLPAPEPDTLNSRVLALIEELSDSPDSTLELRLVPSASGEVVVEVSAD